MPSASRTPNTLSIGANGKNCPTVYASRIPGASYTTKCPVPAPPDSPSTTNVAKFLVESNSNHRPSCESIVFADRYTRFIPSIGLPSTRYFKDSGSSAAESRIGNRSSNNGNPSIKRGAHNPAPDVRFTNRPSSVASSQIPPRNLNECPALIPPLLDERRSERTEPSLSVM